MAANPQSRKWMLTINNPQDWGLDHSGMQRLLSLFCPDYFCLADEIATTGTFHTHIFIYSKSPIRFSTLKNRFPTAHIEKAFGSAKDNRDYIRKEGKWLEDKKAETSVVGSFYEFGLIPSECEERDPKMYKLLQNVKDGLSTTEIIDESPNFAFKSRDIDTLREAYRAEQYMSQNRKLTVTYLYGATGTGKTSGIYKKHPATEICRITDYNGKNGVRFDAYHGQDVLVFEEFNSQIPIEAMLNYLDIYPLMLPARYTDRTACFTKVYITSNIPLNEQYIDVRHNRLETWKAFIRRIDHVFMYMPDGSVEEIYFK